jgi:hypothetical protein
MNVIKIFYMAQAKENIAIYGVVSKKCFYLIRKFRGKSNLENIQPKRKMLKKVSTKFPSRCPASQMKISSTLSRSEKRGRGKDLTPAMKRRRQEPSQ